MSVKNTNETAVERENIQENRPGTDQPDAILVWYHLLILEILHKIIQSFFFC